MDSNHGPRPYQGRALTKLSYAPANPIGVKQQWVFYHPFSVAQGARGKNFQILPRVDLFSR